MPTPNRTEKLRATAAKLNASDPEAFLRSIAGNAMSEAKREAARTKRHRRVVETQLARIADAIEDIAVTSHTLALLAERVDLVGTRFNALVDQIAGRG
jgi:hypothetical protein